MTTSVLRNNEIKSIYTVTHGYAYKLIFDIGCTHFSGKIGRLGVNQNNEEIASKETLTIGRNGFIIYPQSTGELELSFKFSKSTDSVKVSNLEIAKLEAVMRMPSDLQSFEIFAAVASIPQRESSLRDVIDSILPQVDKLFVYLNGYECVPNFVVNKKIEYVLDPVGRTAAAAKLYWLKYVNGYYFSIDDDILYPSDYCVKTIEHYKELNEPCMVSYHGKNYSILATHQRLDRIEFFQFENEQLDVNKAHVLGTGVAMLDTRTVKVDLYEKAAKHPRSIDLAVSIALRESGVSRYTLPKNEGWLRQSKKVTHGLNEFKQIKKSASSDVDRLMFTGLPWVESKLAFKFIRSVFGWILFAIPSSKHKKIKKLLRDPRKFFSDSKFPLLRNIVK